MNITLSTINNTWFLYLLCLLHNVDARAADSLETEKNKLLNGGITVYTVNINDNIIGVTGKIFITFEPAEVWEVLVDYNNLHNFIPGLIESKLLQDNGDEKIIAQTGETWILIFSKTVYLKLKVKEDYLNRIVFKLIEGDFKVYDGEWVIDYNEKLHGTFLTYKANVQPDFFVPAFITRYVQEKDLTDILRAIREKVELNSESADTLDLKH